MATSKLIASVDLYRALMFEARMRIEAINIILDGRTGLPEGIARELCYLQLRMLCELIALGALVIHGDISAKNFKRFGTQWSADKIISELESLHPHFYPQPVEIIADQKEFRGGNKPNSLSKRELFSLYGKCGDILHRGTLKKILRSDQTKHGKIHVPDVVKWTQKIEDLLGVHAIVLADGKTIVVCILRDAGRNLQTTTIITENVPALPAP